uniref:Uncharacterized protein n=1 Tax=Rhizophora mucronata TaxID=61149 RepID=A0A2P2L8V1_RHIMU
MLSIVKKATGQPASKPKPGPAVQKLKRVLLGFWQRV